MKAQLFKQEEKTLLAKWGQYKGKIVAVVGDKIFAATSGAQAKIMIQKLEKKHGKPPLVTYIPKAEMILFHRFGVLVNLARAASLTESGASVYPSSS